MRSKFGRVGAGVSVHTSRYTDAIHSFFLMAAALDEGKKCIDEATAFLEASLRPATCFLPCCCIPFPQPIRVSTATTPAIAESFWNLPNICRGCLLHEAVQKSQFS